MNWNIYGLGSLMWDHECHITEDQYQELRHVMGLERGSGIAITQEQANALSTLYKAEKRELGGSAYNTVAMMARFGDRPFFTFTTPMRSAFIMSLPIPPSPPPVLNRPVCDLLKEDDIRHTIISGGPAVGDCFVFVTPDGERSMAAYLPDSDLHFNLNYAQNSRMVFIDGYTIHSHPDVIHYLKTLPKRTKLAISLSSPEIAQSPHVKELLQSRKVDLVFGNAAEVRALFDEDFETAICNLKEYCKMFAITRGSLGAVVWDGARVKRVDSPKVKAVNTVGCGDTFAAAFLTASSYCTFEEAAQFACMQASRLATSNSNKLSLEDLKAEG